MTSPNCLYLVVGEEVRTGTVTGDQILTVTQDVYHALNHQGNLRVMSPNPAIYYRNIRVLRVMCEEIK